MALNPWNQALIVAVLGTCLWAIFDEASGNRALRDEAAHQYWEGQNNRTTNGTRYFDGWGNEISRAQAYNLNPTGFIGRTVDSWAGFMALLGLGFLGWVAWRLRHRSIKLTEFLPIALLCLMLFLAVVCLYLVDIEVQDPRTLKVHVANPDLGQEAARGVESGNFSNCQPACPF